MVQVVFNTHHAASSPGGFVATHLLKLTLVSEEGVYCYVNGRVFTQSADHSDLFLPSRDTDREAPLLFAH